MGTNISMVKGIMGRGSNCTSVAIPDLGRNPPESLVLKVLTTHYNLAGSPQVGDVGLYDFDGSGDGKVFSHAVTVVAVEDGRVIVIGKGSNKAPIELHELLDCGEDVDPEKIKFFRRNNRSLAPHELSDIEELVDHLSVSEPLAAIPYLERLFSILHAQNDIFP